MEKKTNFRTLSKKQKIEYIWDYYKWHIIVVVAILAAIGSLIHHYATYKETVLDVIMINSNYTFTNETPGLEDYYDIIQLKPKTEKVSVDASLTFSESDAYSTNYYSDQTLSLRLSVGGSDILFSNESVFTQYASLHCFTDLTTVLTEEELAEWADLLVYVTEEETNYEYPCGILLPKENWSTINGYYSDSEYLSISCCAENLDNAVAFLRYVLNYCE